MVFPRHGCTSAPDRVTRCGRNRPCRAILKACWRKKLMSGDGRKVGRFRIWPKIAKNRAICEKNWADLKERFMDGRKNGRIWHRYLRFRQIFGGRFFSPKLGGFSKNFLVTLLEGVISKFQFSKILKVEIWANYPSVRARVIASK